MPPLPIAVPFLCDSASGGVYLKPTPMSDDLELLRRYAEDRSDEAFAELVKRYVDLVYSAALRKLNGDTHLAKDVTQAVFIKLAAQPPPPADRRVLAGWLYTTAHNIACKVVRSEVRRREREQEAQTMHDMTTETAAPADWKHIRPVLDDAMHELARTDRDAIVFRFFERRPFAEVGAKLGLSENAARMRVERALDKLHGLLACRGIRSSSAAFAAILTEQAVTAAPTGLAVGVTSAAVTAGVTAGGTFATLTLLNLMSTVKSMSLAALIVVSLAANALFIAGLANRQPPGVRLERRGSDGPTAMGSSLNGGQVAGTPARSAADGSGLAGVAPKFKSGGTTFERLLSDDPATFAANLLAAGFSRAAARGAVVALLRNHDNLKRVAAIKASPPPPYWKTTESTSPSATLVAAFGESQLARAKILRDLFPEEGEYHSLTLSRAYGPLSVEKQDRIEALDADYSQMRQQLLSQSTMRMPWDVERLALLDKEREKDLRQILTPEEFDQYDFRTSPVAVAIRQLPEFNPSEEEFRALFTLKSAFDDKFRIGSTTLPPAEVQQAQQTLNAQIKSALGDTRFAVYEIASDRGYQEAYMIAQQLNLPTENAMAVYQIQRDTLAR